LPRVDRVINISANEPGWFSLHDNRAINEVLAKFTYVPLVFEERISGEVPQDSEEVAFDRGCKKPKGFPARDLKAPFATDW
jgi:hypothetical protein